MMAFPPSLAALLLLSPNLHAWLSFSLPNIHAATWTGEGLLFCYSLRLDRQGEPLRRASGWMSSMFQVEMGLGIIQTSLAGGKKMKMVMIGCGDRWISDCQWMLRGEASEKRYIKDSICGAWAANSVFLCPGVNPIIHSGAYFIANRPRLALLF